ncbi:hypothetical protein RR42_s1968 [Cupriavidus basilensis]|uniref:Uncharacterized protein n=1 Tax=Cupriavidus basilensis TaxID=68895 RepID=A0A0C4YSF6_9BURK|nr:hypothetical protein RR42_s1968 [Cupriavidus basilensis]
MPARPMPICVKALSKCYDLSVCLRAVRASSTRTEIRACSGKDVNPLGAVMEVGE